MRLFRRKKNNRGFSLVETVCAVAILGLTSTAIGSAMVMSTENYQRGNTEVDVQKEAQLATNLIGNLLVDAVNATYTESTKTLLIEGEGIEYEIVYNPATKKLTYKETKQGGTTVSGTLAENVSHFKPDLTNWTSKNARIDMSIDKNGKNYEASYNTTARNGDSFNVGAAESAFIICETELVLEPGQEYDLPLALYGNPETPGFDWSNSPLVGSDVGGSYLTGDNDSVKIVVGADASDMFTFAVRTAEKDDITLQPLDTKTVTVKIRRATAIDKNVTITGTEASAGTTYQIAATALADNPDQVIGKEFDAEDYKDPRKVAFTVVPEGSIIPNVDYTVTTMDGQVNVALINNLPTDSKITVNIVSTHANGTYNKTGTAYDPNVKDSYVIENTQSMIGPDSGIKRGDDNFLSFKDYYDKAGISADFGIDVANDSKYLFRYRRKDLGASDNSPYYRLKQNNTTNDKFNAIETWLWYAGYAYEIDVILVVVDDENSSQPKLRYPQDESLLADLQTTYPGIVRGWSDADESKTNTAKQLNQYGGTLEIGAAMLKYDGDADRIGSESAPGFRISQGESKQVNFSGINMKADHFNSDDYGMKVYCRTEGSGWQDVSSYTTYFNVQYSNQFFIFKEFTDAAKGLDFKIVPTVKNRCTTVASVPQAGIPNYNETQVGPDKYGVEVYPLANEATGQGCIYFSVNE